MPHFHAGYSSSGDKILCCAHPYAFNLPYYSSALASLSHIIARKPVAQPRMVYCYTENCYNQAYGNYDYCASRTFFVISCNHQSRCSTLNDRLQDVCSYGGCGNERYKSSYGTRYECCSLRKPLFPSCAPNLPHNNLMLTSPAPQFQIVARLVTARKNPTRTQTPEPDIHIAATVRPCPLFLYPCRTTRLRCSFSDRCWQGDCARQGVARTGRCAGRKFKVYLNPDLDAECCFRFLVTPTLDLCRICGVLLLS